VERAREGYSQLDFSSSCDVILNIASAGNVYMNDRTPWSLFKQGGLASNEASQVFPPMFPMISNVLLKWPIPCNDDQKNLGVLCHTWYPWLPSWRLTLNTMKPIWCSCWSRAFVCRKISKEIGGFVAIMIWIVQLPLHKCRQGFKVNHSLVVYELCRISLLFWKQFEYWQWLCLL